jgi:hypothetical protein
MAEVFFMIDRLTGDCALFEEAPGPLNGDYSRNDPRNRPLLDPEGWIHLVHFHTRLDNMAVHLDSAVLRNHTKVKAKLGLPVMGVAHSKNIKPVFSARRQYIWLLNHNLGYIPWVKVRVGNNSVSAAYPVQTLPGGRARWISVWADTVSVYLTELVDASDEEVPALNNVEYRVMVFKRQPAPTRDANNLVFPAFDDTNGLVTMAGGRFNADAQYAQVVTGGSPFSVSLGRTMDAKNGAPRMARPDGTVYDQYGTKGLRMTLISGQEYGEKIRYNGSFLTNTITLIQAP